MRVRVCVRERERENKLSEINPEKFGMFLKHLLEKKRPIPTSLPNVLLLLVLYH